jgi:hypothetical protein
MLLPRFTTRIAANGGGQNDDTEKPAFMLRGCLSKCGLIILPDSFNAGGDAAARTRARERQTFNHRGVDWATVLTPFGSSALPG